ncbi:MAG: carbohydrate kinase family protein [Firmicutes bacterium]|nr:carbohydrate kinase family protein [Bacillota bacterium]
MKVLCIGESLLEITCPVNDAIGEGKKLRLEEKFECGSGHAGNVAYLLGKWGVETYIASMMGGDDAADKIKKEFETIGVKTDYVETSYDKSTGQKLVLINKTSKEKTILDIISNANLKKYSFSIEPDLIITDGNDFNATVSACDKYSTAKSFLLASRTNNEILELCKYVNYIIFNKDTSEQITSMKIDFNDSSSLVNIYNRLKQKYNNAEIIITLGERGCVYSINSQVKIMPTVRTEVVDTNGAGDVFAGSFAYGIGRDFGLEKAIAYATIAASFSTTKMTSRMSIPTITEVSTYYDNKFGAINNPNNQNSETNTNNLNSTNMNTTEESSAQNNNVNTQNA